MAKEKLAPIPKGRRKAGAKKDCAAQKAVAQDPARISANLGPLAWPTEKLQLHPENPRVHSEKHIAELAASLKKFGQVKNIIASSRLDPPAVVCGNGTLRAALGLGWHTIAVAIEKMTLEQERQLLILDNLLPGKVEWDDQAVARILAGLQTGEAPLDDLLAGLGKPVPLPASGNQEPANNVGGKRCTYVCPNCNHEFTLERKGRKAA